MFDELIRLVHKVRAAKAERVRELERQINELTQQRGILAEPFEKQEADLIAEWRDRVIQYGKPFKCADGKIAYRKGATRRSWDLDGLDALCAADGEAKELIWRYRHVTVGEPSFTVE